MAYRVHELKIEKEYLSNLYNGVKRSEIRFNDRDYQKGDILKFHNTTRRVTVGDPEFHLCFRITHIHSGLGLKENYVCLSVEITNEPK